MASSHVNRLYIGSAGSMTIGSPARVQNRMEAEGRQWFAPVSALRWWQCAEIIGHGKQADISIARTQHCALLCMTLFESCAAAAAPVITVCQRRRVIFECMCQLRRELFRVVVDQGIGKLLEEGVLRVSWAHEPAKQEMLRSAQAAASQPCVIGKWLITKCATVHACG